MKHMSILIALAIAACVEQPSTPVECVTASDPGPTDDIERVTPAPDPAASGRSGLCPVGDEDCVTLPLRKFGDQWLATNYPSAERDMDWGCRSSIEGITCSSHVRIDYFGQTFECTQIIVTPPSGNTYTAYDCTVGPDFTARSAARSPGDPSL